MGRKQQSVFYSHDLCAKYFTFTDAEDSRFVLFDDADTLRRKLRMGQCNLGFFYYHGIGVEEDNDQAFHWFSQSAEKEYHRAEFFLGGALPAWAALLNQRTASWSSSSMPMPR